MACSSGCTRTSRPATYTSHVLNNNTSIEGYNFHFLTALVQAIRHSGRSTFFAKHLCGDVAIVSSYQPVVTVFQVLEPCESYTDTP